MPTLNWIGKDKILNHHNDVPYRVLEKKYTFDEKGMHEDEIDSDNMIIHGDNLEVLKSLLPMYEGKIKCIYIDPPYNTAKSSEANKQWVYSDSVDDPKIALWLNRVVGDEGEDFSRHDKWLCMMYPRLRLLHKLLANDGIIFISIDDNEQHNLRIICDEIFGKSSFLCQFVWRSDGNFDNQAKIKVCHEYILAYIKKPELLGLPNGIDPNVGENSKIFKPEIRNTVIKNGPKNPMSVITLKKGFPCVFESGIIKKTTERFPHYLADAVVEDFKLVNDVEVESGWSSKSILQNYMDTNFSEVLDSKGQKTVFEITSSGTIEMVKKRENISHVMSVLSNLGSTQNMSNELAKMGLDFDFPKPVDLVVYLIGFYCSAGDIVLDSFAGSGTTAHAVIKRNHDNCNEKLRFILVEMNDYCETITASRIKQVIQGYKDVPGLGGSFSYYELGENLFDSNNKINSVVPVNKIREYIWYMETNGAADIRNDNSYLLGVYNSTAYYFLYEEDKATSLDMSFLSKIKEKQDAYIIYADACTIAESNLAKWNITFKKIPRDIPKL